MLSRITFITLPALVPLAATAATDESPVVRWGIAGVLSLVMGALGVVGKRLLDAHIESIKSLAASNEKHARAALLIASELRQRPCLKDSLPIQRLAERATEE
ncbi:MAG TPA: hypothetical protein VNE39_16280 [Planctomycetota bacterium]|nr:hypothetical protein [Planctomycetota bacterium]